MALNRQASGPSDDLAMPLHFQHLERCLDVEPFLDYVEQLFNTPISDGENISEADYDQFLETDDSTRGKGNGILCSTEERRCDKSRLYNFTNLDQNRFWLRDVLISDSSDSSDDGEDEPITEEYLQTMLRHHLLMKKYRARYYTSPEPSLSGYSQSLFASQTTMPSAPTALPASRKRKRQPDSNEQQVGVATEYFKRPEAEEDILLEGWAMKFKKLQPDQRKFAEKLINETLFKGEMGSLTGMERFV